jgi:hypothetical protein
MIPRLLLVWTCILSVVSVVVRADDPFDCHLTVDSFKFDLTSLAGEHTLSRTRETPPSSMLDTVRFNLCADLARQTDIAEVDQVCVAVLALFVPCSPSVIDHHCCAYIAINNKSVQLVHEPASPKRIRDRICPTALSP